MKKHEFAIHYFDNIGVGITFLVLSFVGVFLIYRRHIYSIFDPLLFMTVLASSAYSVVFYLYYFEMIADYYFYSFLLTQFFFFIGFSLNKPIRFNKEVVLNETSSIPSLRFNGAMVFLYPIAVFLYIFSQLVVYKYSGIPLFMESRLQAFSGGGGYGFLRRVIYVTSIISVALAFFRIFYVKTNIFGKAFDYFTIAVSVIFAGLSGSKAALLLLIFTCFFVIFFSRKFGPADLVEKRAKRVFLSGALVAVPLAVMTLVVQSGLRGWGDVSVSLLMRFINTGDIFYMALPNNLLGDLTPANGFMAMFKDVLGALRIFSWEELPVNLGLQVFWANYNVDLISGPNARHNIFGLFYFGVVGGAVLSFCLGFFVSFIRNRVYLALPATLSSMIFYVLLCSVTLYVEQDPAGMAVGYYFSIFLIYPVLYGFSLLLFSASKSLPKRVL